MRNDYFSNSNILFYLTDFKKKKMNFKTGQDLYKVCYIMCYD